MVPLVKVEHISKTYGKDSAKVQAVRDVSVSLYGGDFVGLMGPSGSGKSTLLHLIGCLDSPTSGKITIDGCTVSSYAPRHLWEIRNKKIGFVFQNHQLIPTLTAVENVILPLKYARVSKNQASLRAHDWLTRLGLAKRANHFPSQLSGGEQARVAIARALVNDPTIMLADEPTGELDSTTGEEVLKQLAKFSSKDRAILLVTHDPQVAKHCQLIYEMRDGRFVN